MSFTRSKRKVDNKGSGNPHRVGCQLWASKELGVHNGHLNMVLRGRRESRSLKRRYRELMESLEKEASK